MPTYDYVCSKCEHTFEQFQSMTAKPLRKCPSCGGMALKRLIGTGAGVIFRGSGFYETDYRSDSYQKAAKADSTATSGTDTKPPKSDTAAKTDASTSSSNKSAEKPAKAK